MSATTKAKNEQRDITGAVGVILRGAGRLIVEQGKEESLTIEAPPDLLPYIHTSVEEGIAVIALEKHHIRNFTEWQTTIFHITLREITQLSIEGGGMLNAKSIDAGRLSLRVDGGGHIVIDDLNAKSLKVRIAGAGNFKIAGEAKHQDIDISGAGNHRAGHLRTEHTAIHISGAGNGSVWAEETLKAQISGVGRIGYYGSPEVDKQRDGIGIISRLGGKPKV